MARSFNGIGDYVSVTHASVFDVGDVLTIHAWVKKGADGVYGGIFNVGGDNTAYLRVNTANALEFLKSGVSVIVTSTSTITNDGLWHPVGATKNGATSRIFLDGADVTGTVTNATMSTSTEPLVVFVDAFLGGLREYFNGSGAEAALWSVALSPTQMKGLASGARPFQVAPDNLRGYWPLFGNSPEPDYSGNRNSGTLAGSAVVAHPPVLPGMIRPFSWFADFTPAEVLGAPVGVFDPQLVPKGWF